MNKFTIEYTNEGFTETLEYEGKTIVKRYERDKTGWRGLDRSWDYEEHLPDEVIEALESGDDLELMDALTELEEETC